MAELPSRSATVTHVVSSTKARNIAMVTVVTSMVNGVTRTACTGCSPSAG